MKKNFKLKPINPKFKHECVRCKYYTNDLFNYNKHLQTSVHLHVHNTCNKCMKVFRDKTDLGRHTNKKKSCVKVPDQPITINIDNSIKIDDHSINTNNGNYIEFSPYDHTGNKFKILKKLKSKSDTGYFNEKNIQELKKNILLLLDKENFDEIKENKITDDILNTNDPDLISSKISTYNKLCNSNKLLKNIAPTISQLSSNINCIGNKLRLYPHLVSDQELDNEKEDLDEFKKHNTEKINLFITNLMTEALINTNMNPENINNLGIVEYDNEVCVKHNKKQLELLDVDKVAHVTKILNIVHSFCDDLIDSKLVDFNLIELDDKKTKQDIKEKFKNLVDNYNNYNK